MTDDAMSEQGAPGTGGKGSGAASGPKPPAARPRQPLPPGTRLRADAALRVRQNGRVLLGGNPLRFVRLTEAGADAVRRWLGGEPPGTSSGAVALARRLVDGGMLHPDPPAGEPDPPVTVIIPVKDDPDGLAKTLAELGPYPVVVVDDGSETAVAPLVAEVAPSAVTIRREMAGGPGRARQDGLVLAETPLVAFVDAGVEVERSSLRRLCGWFGDPELLAVAPRVASTPMAEDPIADYEQAASPLDLGSAPSPVGPGRTVGYVPTACLVARRASVDAVGGFDPDLRYGEDVDLVWRLTERGAVRYDPSVVVRHRPRPTLAQLARQRFGYGTAAAPLAERHGADLAPVAMSSWSAAVLALAVVGRYGSALTLGAATAVILTRKLQDLVPDPGVEAALLTARGHTWAARSAVDAGTRVWWPLPLLAALLGWRRPLRLAWGIGLARRLIKAEGPPSRRLRHATYGAIDDLAYGTGVWVGAIRHRSARSLLPRVVNWPDD